MSRTRRELGDHEWRMQRYEAEAVDCPRCGSRGRTIPGTEGEHCVNPFTGDELRAPAHFQRIEAAKEHP